MGTCSFKDFEDVCRRLGLVKCSKKKGDMWKGIDSNGNLLAVMIHKHAGGRDIIDGTFRQMIKDLGFRSEQDFKDFLENKKRMR